MKKSTKVVLFSLLVFPGSGHFLIDYWQRGIVWISSAGLLLYLLTRTAVTTAQQTLASLDLTGGMDINQLMATANQTAAQNSSGWMSTASWGLGIIWIAAAIDAYQLARKHS